MSEQDSWKAEICHHCPPSKPGACGSEVRCQFYGLVLFFPRVYYRRAAKRYGEIGSKNVERALKLACHASITLW